MDNSATTQKPKKVISASKYFYETINSNVHRGSYFLSQESTSSMEEVRIKIQKFIHAKYSSEILFTKGTTESINLIACSIKPFIKKGDEIIISYSEHHSNIIPWQILCQEKGAILKIISIKKNGLLNLDNFDLKISKKTKLVSINHVSNVLGIINPIKYIIEKSHNYGSFVLIDGAQATTEIKINVQELNVDFYVFSAHKMYGPTGVGILYGKKDILNDFSPYQYGGEMVKNVSFKKTTYSNLPLKFEAGTPNIEGIYVFGKAIDFLEEIGIQNIKKYKEKLLRYTIKKLNNIENIFFYGKNENFSIKTGIISFNIKNFHYFDVGCILDRLGISVRTGSLCAQPLMSFFKVSGMIRISFAIYNTIQEIDSLYEGILQAKKILKKK